MHSALVEDPSPPSVGPNSSAAKAAALGFSLSPAISVPSRLSMSKLSMLTLPNLQSLTAVWGQIAAELDGWGRLLLSSVLSVTNSTFRCSSRGGFLDAPQSITLDVDLPPAVGFSVVVCKGFLVSGENRAFSRCGCEGRLWNMFVPFGGSHRSEGVGSS
ncbi:hypothetical protein VUR80DRAFT_7050 [Thermomyces stellatus]